MSPEDSRHGTYAGYVAHQKTHTPQCDPCRRVGIAAHKRYRLERIRTGQRTIELGRRAWDIIIACNKEDLAARSGISSTRLRQLAMCGPDAVVRRQTRLSIESTTPITALGIARRLQALAVLGWSAVEISNRTGIWPDNLIQQRLGDRTQWARATTIDAVTAVYDELSMRLPDSGRSASATRSLAASKGWVPPMAWDNIDDPDERPKGIGTGPRDYDIDHTVVTRILAGDVVPANRAERAEVVRRWPGSTNELARLTGWKVERYREDRSA